MTGVAGTVSDADVYADLQLGRADFQERLAEANVPGIAGLVGADMLSEYDVEFNLPDGRFRLWRAPGCEAADLPWTGPRSTMPMRVTGGGQLRVPVRSMARPWTRYWTAAPASAYCKLTLRKDLG